ncbi:MAG: TonB-dependent receptor [Sphingobium sp.]
MRHIKRRGGARLRTATFSLAALSAITLALPAHARTTPDEGEAAGDGDIVVTAGRRETRLLETPIAVNALDTGRLQQDRAFRSLNDLAGLAAGLHAPSSSTASTEPFFIRGIGTSRANGNPSVGVYLDDVYVARPFGLSYLGGMPDLERIEILHGPQGTLYGQNTSAGAIKLITKAPAEHFEGWISAGLGSNGLFETRGHVSGPLVPGVLAASLAYVHSDTHGELRDTGRNGKNSAEVRLDQVRGVLRFTPSSRFTATLTLDGMTYDEDYVLAPDPRYIPGAQPRQTHTSFYETPTYTGGGAALKLEQALGDHLHLRSITAWRGYKTPMATDWSTLPTQNRIYGFGQTLRQNQLSQEFQVAGDYDRLNFIAGAILYRESFSVDRLTWAGSSYTTLHSDSLTHSLGLYGQASYKLTDALTLTAGLRYSAERKEMDASSYNSNIDGLDLSPIYVLGGLRKNYDGFTPKVSLDYRFSPNVLVYASWAKGITSGGYNPASSTAAIAAVPVDLEKVTTYEGGLKFAAWKGLLKTNIAVFYNDYRDYQASVTNPVINGQTVPGGVIVNAGDAHTYGLELDSELKPTSRWSLGASVALLRTRFDSFLNPSGAATSNLTGQALPKAPEFTLGLNTTYTLPLGALGSLRFTGVVRHESSSFSDISATRTLTAYPDQTYVDVGLTHRIGHWTTSLTVKNLLDETYILPGLYSPARNIYTVTYNNSRSFLLSVRHDF